jgi:UDP-N-acetylmuramoyl-tripeptide--D-alanyl-D-alanine ligase
LASLRPHDGSLAAAIREVGERPLLTLVDDPLAALQGCAAWWRRQHTALVLAVAGSVGKTTTKELLGAIVEQRFRTLRTPGSFNNELGLPFTLLKLTPAHERVVLEIGISDLGEMRAFAAIAGADLGVMTRVVAEHLHRLVDLDTVEREEGDLIAALPPAGIAVLNAGDERVARMAQRTAARVVWFGEGATAEVRATEIEDRGLAGLAFRLHAGGESRPVTLPLIGRHFVTGALAAVAAAFEAGCAWEEVVAGLARVPEARRLRPRPLPGGVTVLDDAFNASPDSTKAALDVLAALPGRRVAVLGDMYELGEYAATAHRLVGQHVPGRADLLVAVGELGQGIADAASAAGLPPEAVHRCRTNAVALDALRCLLRPGDYVLVKGSHGMHMEEIVEGLHVA